MPCRSCPAGADLGVNLGTDLGTKGADIVYVGLTLVFCQFFYQLFFLKK